MTCGMEEIRGKFSPLLNNLVNENQKRGERKEKKEERKGKKKEK